MIKSTIAALLMVGVVQAVTLKDTVTIPHKYYSTTFDTVRKYPVLVQWWVTKKMLTCTSRWDRMDNFNRDPNLPGPTSLENDYKGSGYDRGHNMPAYDNGCSALGMAECFYYSNMTPQDPRVNRGDWKVLEDYTRDTCLKYDSIKVWCGSVGSLKKINDLTVPKYCWKVIYIKNIKTYQAFLFLNTDAASVGVAGHRTTTDAVYKLSGIKIRK